MAETKASTFWLIINDDQNHLINEAEFYFSAADMAQLALQVVSDRLSSPFLQKLVAKWNLKDNLQKLQRTLPALEAILEDEQQMGNGRVVIWSTVLKDFAAHAEDLLEELSLSINAGFEERRSGMEVDDLDTQYEEVVREVILQLQRIADALRLNFMVGGVGGSLMETEVSVARGRVQNAATFCLIVMGAKSVESGPNHEILRLKDGSLIRFVEYHTDTQNDCRTVAVDNVTFTHCFQPIPEIVDPFPWAWMMLWNARTANMMADFTFSNQSCLYFSLVDDRFSVFPSFVLDVDLLDPFGYGLCL
ncbi:hypothetical protein FNV43_RR22942 [Rhamnella rubrinervis]|uniref:Disease resistance N-terminal domain-containing protein n=1 Tax=Rhamnella rubrinervis TaxID=2594499 RepID=A0A8K0GVL2_9ROSA|nr:hypothetical protein FNV43_RR22942 [Rhamnella rubrinervis]